MAVGVLPLAMSGIGSSVGVGVEMGGGPGDETSPPRPMCDDILQSIHFDIVSVLCNNFHQGMP
jgi:hypothetical protein